VSDEGAFFMEAGVRYTATVANIQRRDAHLTTSGFHIWLTVDPCRCEKPTQGCRSDGCSKKAHRNCYMYIC